MSEFVEMMKHIRRICQLHSNCSDCPVDGICGAEIAEAIDVDFENAEDYIIEWVDENPEETPEVPHVIHCKDCDFFRRFTEKPPEKMEDKTGYCLERHIFSDGDFRHSAVKDCDFCSAAMKKGGVK